MNKHLHSSLLPGSERIRFFGLDWSYLMVLWLHWNALFSMRFLVQWLRGQRDKANVYPSLVLVLEYCRSVSCVFTLFFRRDPLGFSRISRTHYLHS